MAMATAMATADSNGIGKDNDDSKDDKYTTIN